MRRLLRDPLAFKAGKGTERNENSQVRLLLFSQPCRGCVDLTSHSLALLIQAVRRPAVISHASRAIPNKFASPPNLLTTTRTC